MTLEDKKALVADFLARCNAYADDKLATYASRLATAEAADEILTLQDKINHWTAYRTFNLHAIGELQGDALDAWFADAGK